MADPRGDILKYTGVNYAFAPTYYRDRAPTSLDVADEQGLYKVPSIWIHIKQTTAPVDADVWILVNLQANNANGATWLMFTGGTGGSVTELRADDGNVAVPLVGIIDIDGNTVANATNATPLFTRANVANTVDIDIQLATTVTPTPGDANDAGLASFNENHFSIDATSGMVSLAGGGIAIDTNTGDDAVAVSPDGAGNFDWTGQIVANATNAKPLFFKTDGGNGELLQMQIADTVTPTPVDSTGAGVASFNENQFSIDATSGMVSGIGDPTLPYVQTLTGDTGGAVGPDANGNIDITGDQTQLFTQVNGTPGSNLQEIKLIEPAADAELLIGNTAASEPLVGTITSNDSSVTVSYDNPNIDLSVGATPIDSAFFAYINTAAPNVTGDGTLYTVVWDAEDLDLNNDYNTSTGVFTAPFDGYFVFHASALLDGMTSSHTDGKFRFRVNGNQIGSSERGNYYNQATPGGNLHHSISSMFVLSANDTVEVILQVGGGTKVVGTLTGSPVRASTFSGYVIKKT